MRIAPSRRITLPLSMGDVMILRTVSANSSGVPRREGKGTCAPREALASSGNPARRGVSNNPGAMVITRIPNCANSRAMGRVMPTMPPLEAE